MVEIVCMTHQGFRCAMPTGHILNADVGAKSGEVVTLWESVAPRPSGLSQKTQTGRAFRVVTADGPRWIEASNAALSSVTAGDLKPLSPLLRGLVRLPHVVGLTELNGELVWLVDLTRFSPEGTLE